MYKQVLGAPMGSLLSPVVANIYMTALEEDAIEKAPIKPSLWVRHVYNNLVISPMAEKN